MKCPYCDQEISDLTSICPHCMANLTSSNNPNVDQEPKSPNELKKKYTKYYIVISIFTISLLILISLNIIKFLPSKENNVDNNQKSTKPTKVSSIANSRNIGINSGKENPTFIGNMTIASIKDDKSNKITPIDVKITRYLTDEEVNMLISSSDQALIEGFVFRGIEYEVYLRDLDYLHDNTINPSLNITLYDTYYLNDFFHLNEHYYKNKVMNFYNGPNIKNNEMAKIQAIYQVPISQSYLICFGENSSYLGCYNN